MVVLSSLAFYGRPHGKLEETTDPEVHQILENRLVYEIGEHEFAKLAPFQVEEKINQLPPSEMKLANLLLGHSVDQLIDKLISIANNSDSVKFILALLVLLTAFSTIVVLMVVSGHLLCEVLGRPHKVPSFSRVPPARSFISWSIYLGGTREMGIRPNLLYQLGHDAVCPDFYF